MRLIALGNRDAGIRDQEARHAMIRPDLLQCWHLGLADIHRVRAARVEAAAAGQIIKRWRPARDAHTLGFIVDLGQRADQVLRIGVTRLLE